MEREEIDYALKVLTKYPRETKPDLIGDLKKNIAPLTDKILLIDHLNINLKRLIYNIYWNYFEVIFFRN